MTETNRLLVSLPSSLLEAGCLPEEAPADVFGFLSVDFFGGKMGVPFGFAKPPRKGGAKTPNSTRMIQTPAPSPPPPPRQSLGIYREQIPQSDGKSETRSSARDCLSLCLALLQISSLEVRVLVHTFLFPPTPPAV